MANQTITIRLNAITKKFNRDVKKSEDAVEDLGNAANDVDNRKFRREMDKNETSVSETESALKKLIKGFIKFKVVMGIIKFTAILTAFRLLLPLLSGVSAALFAIVSSAGILGGAVGFLPAMAFGMLSIFGAVKYATAGVGESLGVLLADSATADEYAAALKKAGPVVAEFADHVNALKDMTESSRGRARDNLFTGLNSALANLRGSGIIQKVAESFERMATILGDVADGFTRMLGKDSVLENLGFLFSSAERSTGLLGRLLTALAEGFIAVSRAAAPVVEYILAELADKMERVNASATQEGMAEFFWRVYDAAKRLGAFLGDLFGGLKNVSDLLTSSGLRDGFLVPFENAAQSFRDFSESADGKNRIAAWFERGVAVMNSFYGLLGAITRGMQNMDGAGGAAALVRFFDIISADGGTIEKLFEALGGLDLDGLVDMFVAVGDALVAVASASESLNAVVTIITLLAKGFGAIANLFGYLPESIRQVVGTMTGLAFLFPFMRKPLKAVAGYLTKMSGRAVVGGVKGLWHGVSALSSGLFGTSTNAAHATGRMSRLGQAIRNGFSRGITSAREFARTIGPSLRTVLSTALTNIALLFQSIKNVFVSMGARIGAFSAAAGAAFTQLRVVVALVFGAIKLVVIGTVRAIGTAILASMTTNPVGWIILAIVALIAVFVLLWKNSETFRNAMIATWEWIKVNWKTLLVFMGPFGLMLRVFIDHFDAIKSGATKAMDAVKSAFASALSFITGLPGFEKVLNFLTPGKGGTSMRNWADSSKNSGKSTGAGDTSAQRGSRGSGGHLSQTLATHRSVDKMTPGNRTISNATQGRWGGSDHHKGKALDLTGSFMGAYRKNLRAMGGMAETHGQGSSAHLHAVYPSGGGESGGGGGGVAVASGGPSGDTMRPRSPASSGGRSIVVEGPLIGQVIANNDMDVTRAVYRALVDYTEERGERR